MQKDRFARPVKNRGAEHTEQNRTRYLVMSKNDDEKQSEKCRNDREDHLRVTASHALFGKRRSKRAEKVAHHVESAALFGINAGVRAEADVQKHKTDGGRDTDSHAEGNGGDDLFADLKDREDRKEDALDENDDQRRTKDSR